ncbi:unnamed protein product [Bemisia tabaci]|uniref:Uncharacterized protein n=1 Tax=Bemisia tabaci TaxID=7038 RepID=A0A9P0EYX6_BEMTA|nr:unnamed protein product [Bemisia tabaci]
MCNYSEEETPVKTVKEKTILTNTPTRRSVRKKQTKKWNHDFDHTWLIRSIKGHSDSVLNMDFSSNGKFLASCSEGQKYLPEILSVFEVACPLDTWVPRNTYKKNITPSSGVENVSHQLEDQQINIGD